MATLNAGTGLDGNITVSSAVDLNTTAVADDRTYADMINYNVSAIGGSSLTTTATPNGIISGDEVILISMQGIREGDYTNVGNYEFFTVDQVNGTTVTFTESITKYYGTGSSNSGLGTGDYNHKVILMRIPQYNNVTINSGGNLRGSIWDPGPKGGIICFRASGTVLINSGGAINMSGRGYKSGYNLYIQTTNGGGLRGQPGVGFNNGPGSARGPNRGGTYVNNLYGYGTYGEETLQKLFMGAGGIGNKEGTQTGNGGPGGGIIAIFATELIVYGSILVRSTAGWGAAGSQDQPTGAAGSLLIQAQTFSNNTPNILGTPDSTYVGSYPGDVGRIALYYGSYNTITGIAPTPYLEELSPPYKISGSVAENSKIYIYNSNDGELIKSEAVSIGAFSISLLSSDPVNVLGVADATNKNLMGFRDVIPVIAQ